MGDINDRVVVFEEDRLVLKSVCIQLQREMRYKAPGNTKVEEDLEAAKYCEIYLSFTFLNPLPLPSVPYSVANSFAVSPSFPPPFFFFLNLPHR